MAKQKTIAGLVEEAAVILQRIVRLKAADDSGYARCVTCGAEKMWNEMDGGHFIKRRFTAHKLREENIHPQCKGCNGPRGGNEIAYTLYMTDTYGREFVDWLQQTKNQTRKYSRPEIMEKIEELRAYEREVRASKSFL